MATVKWREVHGDYPERGRRVQWKNEETGKSGVIEAYTAIGFGGIDNPKQQATHWRYADEPAPAPSPAPAPELTPEQRKQHPLFRGLHGYFPDACMAVANCSFVANEQHNPGEPMHWAREKSTDHEDCIFRHLSDRQKNRFDTDKIRHAAKAAWRSLALLQLEIEEERKLGALVEELDEIPKDEAEPEEHTWPGIPGSKLIKEHGCECIVFETPSGDTWRVLVDVKGGRVYYTYGDLARKNFYSYNRATPKDFAERCKIYPAREWVASLLPEFFKERPECVPEGAPWTYATDGLGRRVAIWLAGCGKIVNIEDPIDRDWPWSWNQKSNFSGRILTPSLAAECQAFYDHHRS